MGSLFHRFRAGQAMAPTRTASCFPPYPRDEMCIRDSSKTISSKKEIAQVAAISANDEQVGQMIADAMEIVGNDGVITVEEAKTMELSLIHI